MCVCECVFVRRYDHANEWGPMSARDWMKWERNNRALKVVLTLAADKDSTNNYSKLVEKKQKSCSFSTRFRWNWNKHIQRTFWRGNQLFGQISSESERERERENEFKHRHLEVGKETKIHWKRGKKHSEHWVWTQTAGAEEWKTTKWCLGGHSVVIVNLTQIYAAIYDSPETHETIRKCSTLSYGRLRCICHFNCYYSLALCCFGSSSLWLLFFFLGATISQMKRRRNTQQTNEEKTRARFGTIIV